MANRNMCFSGFSKQKTAKERCHSLVSLMGEGEEYLETPLPLPLSPYGRSLARSLARWRHNQIFSAWWVTNFSYPWCFAGALRALKLRYKAWLFTSQEDPFIMEKIRNFFHVDCPLIAAIVWRQSSRKSKLHTAALCSLYHKTSTTTISDCSFID